MHRFIACCPPSGLTRAGVAKLDWRGLQIGGAEHDLLRLLDDAGLPEPVQVERMERLLMETKNGCM